MLFENVKVGIWIQNQAHCQIAKECAFASHAADINTIQKKNK